ARPGRDRHGRRERGLAPPHLDRQTGVRGDFPGPRDLVALQGPARLAQPAARNLAPAVAAKAAGSDERDTSRVQPHGGPEEVPTDADALDVADGELSFVVEDHELVGLNLRRGEEVRAGIDRL